MAAPDLGDLDRDAVVAALRDAGARFAFVHGSRARGTARPDSDVDVAAWWGEDPPGSWEVEAAGADLLVLDTAPLELRGRVALEGVLLFDDDPPARVHWLAMTRLVWSDERYRFERSHREFLAAAAAGAFRGR